MKRIFLFLFILLSMSVNAQQRTLKQQMETLQKEKNVNFVYDSSLEKLLQQQVNVVPKQKNTKEWLQLLFNGTDIDWQQQGRYVLLHKSEGKKTQKQVKSASKRRFTLSGYVRDESGESLINATVLVKGAGGTTTNNYGFFSLTLPEDN